MATVKIISPSKEIFDTYEAYAEIIRKALPSANVELIGSFAVPMHGREEIDILVEIDDVPKAQEILSKHHFSKGPIIKGEAFMHGRQYSLKCDVHILPRNDKRAEMYRSLITRLKNDKDLREEYDRLRVSFNGGSIEEYKAAKKRFIEERL